MPILSRDQILAAPDVKVESVDVPEWGGEVLVRVLTGKQRDAFLRAASGGQIGGQVSPDGITAKLVAFSCVDESGALLFTEADIPALEEKSAAALQRVFEVAQRLSGLGGDAVEQAAERLGKAPKTAGGTGSP